MRSQKWPVGLGSFRLPTFSRAYLIVALVLLIVIGSISVYFLLPTPSANFPRVGDNQAAIIDALSIQRPSPTFDKEAVGYLTSAGLSVDVYDASEVTVGFMKSFPAGYSLVIFRVHSGTSRHGVFYFTSEPYDESKYEPEQFRDELRPGKDYEGNPAVFAFGSKFIDTYLQGRFQNAIIVGMGCFGAGTSYGTGEEITVQAGETEEGPNLADAFHRQGATAVIGWNSLVTLEFSERATLELVKSLAVQQLTVRQATEKVNADMGADPIYGSQLTFYPQQKGDTTLLTEPLEIQTRAEATTVRSADRPSGASPRISHRN